MTRLWSRRWRIAVGHHWQLERECASDTAEAWLAQFQKDEPDVLFVLSPRKPSAPKGTTP